MHTGPIGRRRLDFAVGELHRLGLNGNLPGGPFTDTLDDGVHLPVDASLPLRVIYVEPLRGSRTAWEDDNAGSSVIEFVLPGVFACVVERHVAELGNYWIVLLEAGDPRDLLRRESVGVVTPAGCGVLGAHLDTLTFWVMTML